MDAPTDVRFSSTHNNNEVLVVYSIRLTRLQKEILQQAPLMRLQSFRILCELFNFDECSGRLKAQEGVF